MGLVDQIKSWFKSPFDHEQALSLYRTIVAQSRLPVFYGDTFGVADTPDGRFDLIALHTFLVMRRLKDAGAEAVELSQALHDLLFADMDQNLREMGIGDHGMPKRMKKLAEGFRGRIAVYDAGVEAFSADGGENLHAALTRNLYRKTDPGKDAIRNMANYLIQEDRALATQQTTDILQGRVAFGTPESEAA